MATTIKITDHDAIQDAIQTHRSVRFAFPDGRKREMSIASRDGAKALSELFGNIRISVSLDTAIYNTAIACDRLKLHDRTFGNLVEIIDVLEETSRGGAPDPAVKVIFH